MDITKQLIFLLNMSAMMFKERDPKLSDVFSTVAAVIEEQDETISVLKESIQMLTNQLAAAKKEG